jgi:hypothetical protein
MLLLLRQQNGVTAAPSHKLVGNHYNVPCVSFADSIAGAVAKTGMNSKISLPTGFIPTI